MLLDRLDKDGLKHDVDFAYMPVDFKHKCNMGYAFLNFRSEEACNRFATQYHLAESRLKLPGFRSSKVCEVSAAHCQGRDENVMRLLRSPVMTQLLMLGEPEWLPAVIDDDGALKPLFGYHPSGMTRRGSAGSRKQTANTCIPGHDRM
jgi:hypothetical protein